MKTSQKSNTDSSKEKAKKHENSKRDEAVEVESSFMDLRTKRGQILFFLITFSSAILIQFVPLDHLREILMNQHNKCNFTCPEISSTLSNVLETTTIQPKRPKYMIIGDNPNGQYLKHVNLVLNRLGLQRVFDNVTKDEDVDLFWSHSYPFIRDKSRMSKLKGHQKVNHYPGCGFITNKVDLATTNLKYIPKSFKLPNQENEFQQYAKTHPNKLFVQKNNAHRNIKIKRVSEIDFSNNDSFIQEYVDNPLLVDGHKFDIGVYTIITSIDPLRLYIYHGDVLLRYCTVKYHPFDPENIDKYIVGDDYIPTWEMSSLSKHYSLGFGMKGSFDAYIDSKGYDSKILWERVEDAIRQTVLLKEVEMAKLLKYHRYKQAFFEMIRFDLIVDDSLKVYIMEANMSPNLSSAHFLQNTLLYEQVIYNLMSLVGIGSRLERDSFAKKNPDADKMMSADKNVVVNGVVCGNLPCTETCAPEECRLCRPCLSSFELYDLHRSYREHFNRGDTKRIFPVPIKNTSESLDPEYLNQLSSKNQMMTLWFYGKCQMDNSWCN